MNVNVEPKTGDEVHLIVSSVGRSCGVSVNGAELPGLRGFRLESEAGGFTTLAIDAFYPWPHQVVTDANGERRAATRIFTGYFVEQADWRDFEAWRKTRDKSK